MQTLTFELKTQIEPVPLEKGQVHLWWLPLDLDEVVLAENKHIFSDKQKKKVERLPTQEKKNRYIAGRIYLNKLLQAYLPSDASIDLVYGKHGKPALKDESLALQFNFTDTCGYGLFAFSTESILGVDVERAAREGDFERIIQRRFSEEEQQELASLFSGSDDNDAEYFMRCWTRKEAFGKAVGCGLNYTLREQVMCLNLKQDGFSFESALGLDKGETKQWTGQQFNIEQGQEQFVACLFNEGEQQKQLKAFTLS